MWMRGLSGKALPGAAVSVTSFHAQCSKVVRGSRTLMSGRSLSQGASLGFIEAYGGSGRGNPLARLTMFDPILYILR